MSYISKIRVVRSNPRNNEKDISNLIGKEFDVVNVEEYGVEVRYGDSYLYIIHHDEYEIIVDI